MEEQLITFETAKLAKEKGFSGYCNGYYYKDTGECEALYCYYSNNDYSNSLSCQAPTQSLLQRWIRETRGVHIEIHRNASGWYWSMCKTDGGTDLGWSEYIGDCELSGTFTTYEKALESALHTQLKYDLPKDMSIIKHWGNYADFALALAL